MVSARAARRGWSRPGEVPTERGVDDVVHAADRPERAGLGCHGRVHVDGADAGQLADDPHGDRVGEAELARRARYRASTYREASNVVPRTRGRDAERGRVSRVEGARHSGAHPSRGPRCAPSRVTAAAVTTERASTLLRCRKDEGTTSRRDAFGGLPTDHASFIPRRFPGPEQLTGARPALLPEAAARSPADIESEYANRGSGVKSGHFAVEWREPDRHVRSVVGRRRGRMRTTSTRTTAT